MMETEEYRRVDPSKYVVLDVETNGLSSIRDDLLSISIYRPDTGETYNRFLPLELNSRVVTTQYNGIKTKDLVGLLPLSQVEVDDIIRRFEIKNRIILTYGSLDEKFIVRYFKRHGLLGIDYFAFYNFKHEIISSRFSEGNITKDNLCRLYGIENVRSVHSGSNDCLLEWKLFERMNGHRLLVTDNKVFEFNNEYYVPASYLTSFTNFKYYLPGLPQITCESQIVFSLPVTADKLKKFQTNFNGMIVEHLINSMLNVRTMHSENVLLNNKKKLNYIGKLPSSIDIVPIIFNPDGSMTATRKQDKKLEKEINSVIDALKSVFSPLVDYIANVIFDGNPIKSQELVTYPEKKILALCDLSTENAVLEIKATSSFSLHGCADQLYYEANGRPCYILMTDWSQYPEAISYNIHEVEFIVKEFIDPMQYRFEKAKEKIETDSIELLSFTDTKSPVKLRCKKCGIEWNTSYNLARKRRSCPNCSPEHINTKKRSDKTIQTEGEKLSLAEQKLIQNFLKFQDKLEKRSNHQLIALSYKDSRSLAKARCLTCGREWEARADHLLDRPYCPTCKKKVR